LHFFCIAQSGIVENYPQNYIPDQTIYTDGVVRVVRIYDSILYVGGEFTKVYDKKGSHSHKGLAAINLTTRLVTGFKADINSGMVRSIYLTNGKLYAGGTFTKINNILRSKLAALNPETGTVIETFSSKTATINGPVYAVACLDGKLYAGGNFTSVNGVNRSYLAAFDAETGVIDSLINPSPSDSMDYDGKLGGGVYALDVFKPVEGSSGILFVGGNYQTICGESGNQFLVALKPNGTLGPDFNKRISQAVDAIECRDSMLYVGYAGFGNRTAAFKIKTPEYTELWNGYTVNGDVQAVTCSDKGYLYFSFHQGLYDTTDQYRCAVINVSNGKMYDVLPQMSSFFGIYSLDSYKEYLVAGGTFRTVDNKKQNYLAIYKIPDYPIRLPPVKALLKEPENDTIIDSWNVTLKWHFSCFAESYELEIATDSLFENRVEGYSDITSTNKRYSELESAQRYFWRVRGVNQWGKGAWSDYRQFATAPGSDEIPNIIAPKNTSDSVFTNIDCIWNSESKAISYILEIAPQWSFDSLFLDTILRTDTVVNIKGLLNNSEYYLRVRAQTPGGPSEWKTIQFTTIPKLLRSPVAIIPENKKNQVSIITTLVWHSNAEAESYKMQLSKDSIFSELVYDSKDISDTIFEASVLEMNITYYWRLQSVSRFGTSEWSVPWRFTTSPGSDKIPVLISPSKNSIIQPFSTECIWFKVSDALGYSVQVSEKADFSKGLFEVQNTNDTVVILPNLGNKKPYYLRLRALLEGGPSGWAYSYFRTISKAPGKPKLLTPANNADQVKISPLLKWSDNGDAESYRVQLSSDETFSDVILDSTETDTFFIVRALDLDKRYFWRVKAENEAGGEWSLPMAFSTMYPFPLDPKLLYPPSPSIVSTDSITFIWSSSKPYVTQYLIEIAYDSLMRNMIVTSTTSDTTYTLKTCVDHSSIYWRVQAINRSGPGDFSSTSVFVTSISPVYRFELKKLYYDKNNQAVSYTIGQLSNVKILILDLKGKILWEYKKRNMIPGPYTNRIDTHMQPGVYIMRFKAGNYQRNSDIIILR
jgi:hypothetical protein